MLHRTFGSMLRQYELVERVKAYEPGADEALLNRAYVYTVQKHGAQKRASGDPYFSHPIEVAGLRYLVAYPGLSHWARNLRAVGRGRASATRRRRGVRGVRGRWP